MVHPSVCPPFFIALYEQAFMVFYGSVSVHDRMVYEKFHAKKNTAQDLVLSGVDSLSVRAKLLSYSCVSSNRINSQRVSYRVNESCISLSLSRSSCFVTTRCERDSCDSYEHKYQFLHFLCFLNL